LANSRNPFPSLSWRSHAIEAQWAVGGVGVEEPKLARRGLSCIAQPAPVCEVSGGADGVGSAGDPGKTETEPGIRIPAIGRCLKGRRRENGDSDRSGVGIVYSVVGEEPEAGVRGSKSIRRRRKE